MVGMPDILAFHGGSIRIGQKCMLYRSELVSVSGEIVIGDHTALGTGDSIICYGRLHIGDHRSIAPNVTIYDHNYCFDKNGITHGYKIKDANIGKHVWIGTGVIILAGTVIVDNCVIGAGTVVSGSIPPNSLVTNKRELVISSLEERHGKSSNYYSSI